MNQSYPISNRLDKSEHVYQCLLNEVVSGELKPEQALVESELTEKYSVSRTPIREALKRLAVQGLVDIYPQVGSFVAPLRLTHFLDASFVRYHLELALVRQAAKNINEEYRIKLSHNIAMQKHLLTQGLVDRFYDVDEEFHLLIATIAGRPNVWHIIEQHKVHLDRVRHYALRFLRKTPLIVKQHESIAQGVSEGDEEKAVRAMREHLNSIHESLEKWLMEFNTST